MNNKNWIKDEFVGFSITKISSIYVKKCLLKFGFTEKEIPIVNKYIGLVFCQLIIENSINKSNTNILLSDIKLIFIDYVMKKTGRIDLISKFNALKENQTIETVYELYKNISIYIGNEFTRDFLKFVLSQFDIKKELYKINLCH